MATLSEMAPEQSEQPHGQRQGSADSSVQVTAAVLKAARFWWDGLCPIAWDLPRHLTAPTVNTTSVCERKLANTVSNAIRGRYL